MKKTETKNIETQVQLSLECCKFCLCKRSQYELRNVINFIKHIERIWRTTIVILINNEMTVPIMNCNNSYQSFYLDITRI